MFPTTELIDSMVDIEIANLRSRIERYPGVCVETFGSAVAFSSSIPVKLYNSVLGFSDETAEHLDAIRAFYAGRGIDESLEIVPGRLSEPTGIELGRRGYSHVEFHGGYARSLEGAGGSPAGPPPGVAVERIDPADGDAFETFLATHIAGWGGDPGDPDALANVRRWRENERWQFFVARVDGVAAGAGVLDARGELGLLSAGSTIAAFRGRGVQTALIDARVAAAARSGCAAACAGSYWGSPSMRNLLRRGFSMIFVRGIWTRDPGRPNA